MRSSVCLVKSPFENYESLFSEAVLASDRVRSFTNIPLSGDEKLEAGDVIGIDAEFVSLNQVHHISQCSWVTHIDYMFSLISSMKTVLKPQWPLNCWSSF